MKIKKRKWTKKLLTAALCLAVAGGALAFTACGVEWGVGGLLGGANDGLYALAAMSTGEILAHAGNTAVVSSLSDAPAEDRTATEATPEMAAELDGYMALVDALVAADVRTETTVSDRAEYAEKQTTVVTASSGETSVYTLYFTETVLGGDGEEQESRIDGLLLIGTQEFTVIGEREREDDETELEFVAYRDSLNYVVFEQEIENGEQSFAYAVYENGALADAFEFEIETSRGKTEISLELIGEDGVPVEYEITTKQRGDKTRMEVEYTKGNVKSTFDVEAATENGSTVYKYYLTDREIELDD